MVNKGTSNNLMALAAVVVILAVVGYGLGLFGSSEPQVRYVEKTTPQSNAGTPSPPPASIVSQFGSDGLGQYRPAIYSKLNTTATPYLAATIRVYKLDGGTEQFYGTVTTSTNGVQSRDASSGVLVIQGLDDNGNVQKYVAYIPASDGVRTSARYVFDAKEDYPITYPVPEQASLLFKVYDLENRGYVGETTELSGAYGALKATDKSFYSTTSNSTGYPVGQGGFYNYQIYLSTNGTASTATQFEDQELYLAVDTPTLTDWQEPSFSLAGATITKLSSGQYNDKIRADGYDYVYKVTGADGKPFHIDYNFKKLEVVQYARSATNPASNVTIAFYTGGYYQQTTGMNMKMSTNKDDSAQTAVFTPQKLTLVLT